MRALGGRGGGRGAPPGGLPGVAHRGGGKAQRARLPSFRPRLTSWGSCSAHHTPAILWAPRPEGLNPASCRSES